MIVARAMDQYPAHATVSIAGCSSILCFILNIQVLFDDGSTSASDRQCKKIRHLLHPAERCCDQGIAGATPGKITIV